MKHKQSILLYAVCRRATDLSALPVTGLLAAQIEALTLDPFTALISRHACGQLDIAFKSDDTDQAQHIAQTYLSCLNALSAHIDIVPVRLGTVLSDEAALYDAMAGIDDNIDAQLNETAGCQEWTIQLRSTRADPRPAEAASAQDYLRQKQAQRQSHVFQAQERAAIADELFTAVCQNDSARVVREDIRKELAQTGCFLNARLLYPRGCDAELLETLNGVVGSLDGIDAVIYGPEAPFKFAQINGVADAA